MPLTFRWRSMPFSEGTRGAKGSCFCARFSTAGGKRGLKWWGEVRAKKKRQGGESPDDEDAKIIQMEEKKRKGTGDLCRDVARIGQILGEETHLIAKRKIFTHKGGRQLVKSNRWGKGKT